MLGSYSTLNPDNLHPTLDGNGDLIFKPKVIKLHDLTHKFVFVWGACVLMGIILVSKGPKYKMQVWRRIRVPHENTSEMETFLTSNQEIANSEVNIDNPHPNNNQANYAFVQVNVRHLPGLPMKQVTSNTDFYLLCFTSTIS